MEVIDTFAQVSHKKSKHHSISRKMTSRYALAFLFLLAAVATVSGLTALPHVGSRPSTSLNGFGDAFKGAFANEEMGTRKNEGLTGGPDYNENVYVNGMNVKGAVVGQKLTVVAGRVRVKVGKK